MTEEPSVVDVVPLATLQKVDRSLREDATTRQTGPAKTKKIVAHPASRIH